MSLFFALIFVALAILSYRDNIRCSAFFMVTAPLLSHFVSNGFALSDLFSFFMTFVFLMKIGYKKLFDSTFPLKFSLVFFTISLLLANFCAPVENRHTPTMFAWIVQGAVFPCMVWFFLRKNSEKFIRCFVSSAITFGLIVSVYALFETVTGSNPFLEYLSNTDYYKTVHLITEIRYGVKRAQSLFSMHTTLGGCMLYVYAVLIVSICTGYLKKTLPNIVVLVLCLVTIFLTGARSCILAGVVCSLMFIRKISPYRLLYLCIFLVPIFVFIGSYLLDLFGSFVNTEKVNGSNSSMRFDQLLIALAYFEKSPIVGNGIAFLYDVVCSGFEAELYGAESLWFSVMVDFGVVGIVAYLLLFISSVMYSKKKGNKEVLFFIASVFIVFTLSSIPNVNPQMVVPFTLVFNCMLNKRKNESFNYHSSL